MITTHRALLALPLLALTFVAACDTEESNDEFRGGNLDINIQLFQENGDGDGTVIWDIKEVGVYEGDALQAAPLLLTLGAAGEIYDASGVHTCTLKAPYLDKKLFQVTTASDSEVLYTVYNNWILSGEIPPAKLTDGNIRRLLGERLLFTFSANEVWRGAAGTGKLMVSASDDLTLQSQNRKLLISALIEGECGSNGLPGYF
jgi:hypothetical protein